MRSALLLLLLATPLQADLRDQIQAAHGWIGYALPVRDDFSVCTSGHDSMWIGHDQNGSCCPRVVYRVEQGRIEELRIVSTGCPLGNPVRWLEGVNEQESMRLLRELIDGPDRNLAKRAVTALGLHRNSAELLIPVARQHASSAIRGSALFWISQAAGERAASVLLEAVDGDPEKEVREKAVFGISQLPNDQSIPILIRLLKTHRSREVRKKAAFWLGQKNDPRALEAFEEILLR